MKYFWTFFLLITFQSIYAQVLNIEKERMVQDTLQPFKMKLSADLRLFNRSAGENDPNKKTQIEVDYSSIYEPGKHAYILIAEADLERVNKKGIMEFGFIHARINWLKENKLSYETFGQVSYDGARGMDIRTLAGMGIRYALVDNEIWDLHIAPGIMWEYEKWQHPYEDLVVKSDMLKSTNYISLNWTINDLLNLKNVFYYQAGLFQHQMRNRFSNWLILNTKLSQKLSLKNELITNFEDKPIVPITRFIYMFKTGISFNL